MELIRNYGDKLAGMFNPGNYRIVGYGKTCAPAGEALFNGADYKTTGCVTGHGNGSAMRSAPINYFSKASDADLIDYL
jgi:ADP-ribosylglycohydrolase